MAYVIIKVIGFFHAQIIIQNQTKLKINLRGNQIFVQLKF